MVNIDKLLLVLNFCVNCDVINTLDRSVKLRLDSCLLHCSWLPESSFPIFDSDVLL